MKEPKIEKLDNIYYNKYLKLYSMNWDNGAFYLEASRRDLDDLVVNKSEEEYDEMLPDAVTIALVVKTPGDEPRLYMEHEFRYPTGHFLLSPPAGLIDPSDGQKQDPRIEATRREVLEETGIALSEDARIEMISPLFFSSPGMTDESNAIVLAVAELEDLLSLSDKFAEKTECFDGYSLLTKDEVKKLLQSGRDEENRFYSVFTWAIMMHFAYMYEDK